MPNPLIIVESPSKARTLAKFLGASYTIKASMGHVRDLPKSKLGVDVDQAFLPQYEVIKGKEKQIKELQAAAKKAGRILLAADPDREGEAIAWHLVEALKLKNPERVVFHEITKGAVQDALDHPREIDRALVAAQEARRVIDRLVGYSISPLLWRKVRTGLSAGRVQSVAVRLVVDREADIDAFVPQESWTIDAFLSKEGATFTARLYSRKNADGTDEKLALEKVEGAQAVLAALGFDPEGNPAKNAASFHVASIETKETSRSSPPPYTTSTMQQDASTRLRFSPRRTMSIAQELYEGVDIGSEGPTGLITYMRTDSTRISDGAKADTQRYITDTFGKEYVRDKPARAQKAAGKVQDAHEAIRPTDVTRTPEKLKEFLSPAQQRLYELVWRRFVASQMSSARFQNTTAMIDAGDYRFRASGSVPLFDGFQTVWKRDEEKDESSLPKLVVGDSPACERLAAEQHFTQPPPRYTEASLIKELEERGIGRPSTYAPTIEVIQERGYVRQEERRLHPTALGKVVDGVLREHFPTIVDVAFTADLESRLDGIAAQGANTYEPMVREWYTPFAAAVAKAGESMQRVKIPAKETGESCPECETGSLVIREGKFGEFTGCSRYPECSYIKKDPASVPVPTGEMCPDCGKPLVRRMGRRGPFVGCSGYPACRHIHSENGAENAEGAEKSPAEPLGNCPDCGKQLVRRRGRRGEFVGCSGYPSCRHIEAGASGGSGAPAAAVEEMGENCPECSKPLVRRQGRFGPFVSCAGYPKCKYRPPKGAVIAEKVASS